MRQRNDGGGGMTAEAPTIAETIAKIQAALRDYIEATYHVGHPTLIEQRRALLEQEGVLFRAPFIESTPRYQDGPALRRPRPRRAGPGALREPRRTRPGSLKPAPVRPAVHPPGGGAGVDRPRRDRAWPSPPVPAQARRSRSCCRCWPSSRARPLSAPESFAGPGRPGADPLPDERAGERPAGPAAAAARRPARHGAVPGVGGASGSLRPLHQPHPLPGGPQAEEGPAAAQARSRTSTSCCSIRRATRRRPATTARVALIDMLKARGKWPAKPDLQGVVRAEEGAAGRTRPASSSAPSLLPGRPRAADPPRGAGRHRRTC